MRSPRRLRPQVCFDKTGTLTEGKPHVTDLNVVRKDMGSDEALLFALAVAEAGSEHPLASALTNHARQQLGRETFPDPESFEPLPGRGVTCVYEGTKITVGTRKLMAEQGVSISQVRCPRTAHTLTQGRALIASTARRACMLLRVFNKQNTPHTHSALRWDGLRYRSGTFQHGVYKGCAPCA